jgi:transposase
MRKTYKYRLYPNQVTEQKLYFVLNRCRELYDAALSERKDAYKYAGKSISYTELDRDVNAAVNILERGRRQQPVMAVKAPCL